MQTLGNGAETELNRPFNALLLENDQQRADALIALLVRLAAADVRVIRMGGGTGRSHETLEHILTSAAGSDGEAFSGGNARLIVRAIAKPQGHERGVMLLIKQAETMHPTMLGALQAMAPYFVQDGQPTLQVTFVGRPTFLALLDGPGLMPLRQALGLQESPQSLKPEPADTFIEPPARVRPRFPFSKSAGANDLPERVEAARVSRAAQRSQVAGGPGELRRRPLPAPLRAAGSSHVSGGMGRREPTLILQSVALLEPSAQESALESDLESPAEPAVTFAHTLPRRRAPLGPALMLAAFVITATAAYFGLHSLFYRDVPARSVVTIASPGSPPPKIAPPPVPSIPASSTPAPPVVEATTSPVARDPASHGTAMPSSDSAAPLAAEPSTQLRQDFDAFLASSGRSVAALSEAQRDALFAEYLEWRSRNAAPSKMPGATPNR